jgi:hypothetical protein
MVAAVEQSSYPMFQKVTAKYRDFASFLDGIMASSQREEEQAAERVNTAAPSLQVDFLDQLERLQAANRSFAEEPAMAQYREMAEVLEEVAPRIGKAEDEPSIDPNDIEKELGIAGVGDAGELARLRRNFAMRNHPDLVPVEQRERAETRMRIANMLVDEAKARVAGAKRKK